MNNSSVAERLMSNEHWIVHSSLRFGGIRHANRYPNRVYAMTRKESCPHPVAHTDRLWFAHMDYETGGTPVGSQADIHMLLRRYLQANETQPLYIGSHKPESRAATLAWAVLVAEGVAPERAIQRIQMLVPEFQPHPIIAVCLDEVVQANGSIFRVARLTGKKFPAWENESLIEAFQTRLNSEGLSQEAI